MYAILQSTHSGLRWLILLLLIITVVYAIYKWMGRREWTDGNRKLAMVTMSFVHLQFLIGIVLYFISPRFTFSKESMEQMSSRFFMLEHPMMMLLGVILISVGYSVSKRKNFSRDKSKWIALTYLAALILILAGIPWPFMGLGTEWF